MQKSVTRLSEFSPPGCVSLAAACTLKMQVFTEKIAPEGLHAKVNDQVVEILTATLRVTSSGLHLEDVMRSTLSLRICTGIVE